MIFGRVNASDRNITSGSRSCTSWISHSQNGNGLVCGLSTRKISHALLDPEQHDVAQRLPQRDAVGAIEIRIDDVLVFLRRVLGIADRAVGPALEPFRMLGQPGMIRRALDREIERHLHAVALAGFDEAPEIVRACRARDARRRGRLRRCRWHRGCRDRRARPSAHCCGPCGWSCRSDGSAGDRRRRSPAPRSPAAARCSRRTCRACPAPCPGCAGPSRTRRRHRARGRSATTGTGMLRVRSARARFARRGLGTARPSSRAATFAVRSNSRFARFDRPAGRARSSSFSSSSSSRPSRASSETSRPASRLSSMPRRQLAKWSVQASIAEQVAAGLRRREARHASGRCCAAPSARAAIPSSLSLRHSSSAASRSWPSRSRSAHTSIRSPAMRLTG